jgi:hypothetical protein
MQLSMKETFDLQVSLSAVARAASANGTGVDLQNYNAAVVCVIPVSWTDGTHAITIQDSPDNVTFTNVAAILLDGTPPTITAGGSQVTTNTRVGYLGAQRYLRAVQTVSGATTGAVIGVHVLRGQPRKMPK